MCSKKPPTPTAATCASHNALSATSKAVASRAPWPSAMAWATHRRAGAAWPACSRNTTTRCWKKSGLVIVNDEDGGKRYDRFRDRVMFPIRNVKGECIGFGGRVLGDDKPKYLNSPETPVFHKGRELYGLFEARTAIREHGYALVTEGYMDVVALAQLGFPNAVAT